MAANNKLSKVSSVVSLPTNPVSGPTFASKIRHPAVAISTTQQDFVDNKGNIDPANLSRILTQIQQNSAESTLPIRTSPYVRTITIRNISMTSGKNSTIRHGLGEPVGGWTCVRAQPSSAPFSAVEIAFGDLGWPTSLPLNEYIVLSSSATGVYDISFNPV